MGGTAEIGWGLYGPRGTGTAWSGGLGIFRWESDRVGPLKALLEAVSRPNFTP